MNGMLFLYFCAAKADAGNIETGTTRRQTGFARQLQIFSKALSNATTTIHGRTVRTVQSANP